jgi:hypothetical protein
MRKREKLVASYRKGFESRHSDAARTGIDDRFVIVSIVKVIFAGTTDAQGEKG